MADLFLWGNLSFPTDSLCVLEVGGTPSHPSCAVVILKVGRDGVTIMFHWNLCRCLGGGVVGRACPGTCSFMPKVLKSVTDNLWLSCTFPFVLRPVLSQELRTRPSALGLEPRLRADCPPQCGPHGGNVRTRGSSPSQPVWGGWGQLLHARPSWEPWAKKELARQGRTGWGVA